MQKALSYVPVSVFSRCDEGSASLATLEQSSLERGHSSPPAASNRLSLENSVGGRETNRGWLERKEKQPLADEADLPTIKQETVFLWNDVRYRTDPPFINQCHLTFPAEDCLLFRTNLNGCSLIGSILNRTGVNAHWFAFPGFLFAPFIYTENFIYCSTGERVIKSMVSL